MFVCPNKLILPNETVYFELPKMREGSSFNYPQSEGLAYEADEVRRCILLGKCCATDNISNETFSCRTVNLKYYVTMKCRSSGKS
jgi:hypothetical protein